MNIESFKKYDFYKNNKNDTIFWVDKVDSIGEFLSTKRKYITYSPIIHIILQQKKKEYSTKKTHIGKTFLRTGNNNYFIFPLIPFCCLILSN